MLSYGADPEAPLASNSPQARPALAPEAGCPERAFRVLEEIPEDSLPVELRAIHRQLVEEARADPARKARSSWETRCEQD